MREVREETLALPSPVCRHEIVPALVQAASIESIEEDIAALMKARRSLDPDSGRRETSVSRAISRTGNK